MEEITKIIDVEKSVRTSNSGFLKSLPGFILKLIIKFIGQEEMNRTIYKHREKSGVPFIDSILREWNVNIEIKGSENLPRSGRFIFVANHPVGGMEAMAFLSMIYRFFPDVISPSNQLLYAIPNIRPLMLPVNVFNKNTRETARKLHELFESDSQVMIFPAGEVSRRVKGKIEDPVWQKSFITKAIQHKRDIIPVFIDGKNSRLFYNVASLRKILGIKMYVEAMLLPREMLNQRNIPITFSIGKPISYQSLTGEKTHPEWAQWVKDVVYSLSEG